MIRTAGRRYFLKRASSLLGLTWMGFASAREFGTGGSVARIGVGFPGGAPKTLGPASHPAAYWEKHGDVATCLLCPHQCLLGDGDR
ncbi:MAG: hypothetical protein MUF54_15110, partial [Polyangiaceae bacterium]|nr:hypothetical protein [Polyangiaceae bacterium]